MLNVAILVRVCPYCEQIAHVGDERVVPSGCDYERGDALRVGHVRFRRSLSVKPVERSVPENMN